MSRPPTLSVSYGPTGALVFDPSLLDDVGTDALPLPFAHERRAHGPGDAARPHP